MKAAIFTGSRVFSNMRKIFKILFNYSKEDIIIHGHCPRGADMLVHAIGRMFGRTIIPMPAQWDEYGRAAGHKRNTEMLNVLLALRNCGYDVHVEAFPTDESVGTYDMIKQARKHNVKATAHGE